MLIRRFTIRFLILVVALAAFGVWGVEMRHRSTVLAQTAEKHAHKRDLHRTNASVYDRIKHKAIQIHLDSWVRENKASLDSLGFQTAAYRRDAVYEDGLYRKYHRAAIFPYLSVAADAPPPEPSGSTLTERQRLPQL